MAKEITVWKTKQIDRERAMICQNSNPALSKYPNWGPEVGVCDNWSKVGHQTTAVLCSDCTQRSLNA